MTVELRWKEKGKEVKLNAGRHLKKGSHIRQSKKDSKSLEENNREREEKNKKKRTEKK